MSTHHRYENGEPKQQTVKWTDEKHNLYLRYLEASFVTQLHGSTGLFGTSSEQRESEPNSTSKLPINTCNSSDQFTVLHSGRWKKKKFVRIEPSVSAAADSHVIAENQWINHFRPASKRLIVNSPVLREINLPISNNFHCKKRDSLPGLPRCPEQLYPDQRDSIGSISEVSDQNFEGDDPKSQPSSLSMAKRLKVEAADPSSNDQVVPSQAAPVNNTSFREVGTRHQSKRRQFVRDY